MEIRNRCEVSWGAEREKTACTKVFVGKSIPAVKGHQIHGRGKEENQNGTGQEEAQPL